jgi:hemolysin III
MNIQTKSIKPVRLQTIGEEIANSLLHGFGALLSIAGLVLLVLRMSGFLGGTDGGAKAVAACTIYASSMLIMFLASTLYHAMPHSGVKRFFRIIDHSAIYLLIAGTYTPICLLILPAPLGWIIFGTEWALAAAGIVLQAVQWRFLKKAEIFVYIIMGWACAAAAPTLGRTVSPISIVFLFAGGLVYLIGIIWYKKPQTFLCHVVWHVFVLAGAICHWWSIFLMVK